MLDLLELDVQWERFERRLAAIEGASRDTLHSYRHTYRLFRRYLEETGEDMIDQETVEGFLIWLQDERGLNPRSVARHYYALKKFLTWLGAGDIDWAGLRPRPRIEFAPRILSEEEVQEIIRHAYTAFSRKHGLMLWLGYEAALRAGELVSLRAGQFNPERASLVKRPLKREDPCEVPLSEPLARELQAWIEAHGLGPRDYLFTTKYGRPYRREIFHAFIFRPVVESLGYRELRYHDFARHSRATNLLRRGVDIYTVNRILCHRLLQTTTKYLHIVRAEEIRERLQDALGAGPKFSGPR